MGSYLVSQHLIRCKSDPNVYMLRTSNSLLVILLYEDDIQIIGSSTSTISIVKTTLHERFSMKYMTQLHLFLGIEINQNYLGIKISQSKYVRDLFVRFYVINYNPTTTPFLSGAHLEDGKDTLLVDCTMDIQLFGSLLYIIQSHSYLSYVVAAISRYTQEPHELHWKFSKCILKYVQGTINYGIHYEK